MKTADELARKLKEIESAIKEHENTDGTCTFDTDKVYIFLETALAQVREPA